MKQKTNQQPVVNQARRVQTILSLFDQRYPEADCTLNYRNEIELLIATILSAQCTDQRVNIVTKKLFYKYRKAADFVKAPLSELEQAIRSTGFYRNKALAIQGCCRLILEQHGGKVPHTLSELIQFPGVGRKTANVILGNAFHIDEGVVVDTHVKRLSGRLGFTKHQVPEKIEQDLIKLIPRKKWTRFAHQMIQHGRKICTARCPACARCFLSSHCPSVGKF